MIRVNIKERKIKISFYRNFAIYVQLQYKRIKIKFRSGQIRSIREKAENREGKKGTEHSPERRTIRYGLFV